MTARSRRACNVLLLAKQGWTPVDVRDLDGDERSGFQLLLELIPGGAKKDLSAAQAKALLAKVRPRNIAGKTRRRAVVELIGDLELRAQEGRRQGAH